MKNLIIVIAVFLLAAYASVSLKHTVTDNIIDGFAGLERGQQILVMPVTGGMRWTALCGH